MRNDAKEYVDQTFCDFVSGYAEENEIKVMRDGDKGYIVPESTLLRLVYAMGVTHGIFYTENLQEVEKDGQ